MRIIESLKKLQMCKFINFNLVLVSQFKISAESLELKVLETIKIVSIR